MNNFFDQIPFFFFFCNFKNGQKSIFELGKTATNAISRGKNCWCIWFHEFFCLDFFKLSGLLWVYLPRLIIIIYFNYFPSASPKIFTPERLPLMGQALCKNEHFGDLIAISLIPPKDRTQINPSLILSAEEKEEYDNCQIVYIYCHP